MAYLLPTDGLSSIRPEIEQFVSRENRRHGDPWLQQVGWAESERTLTLFVRKPPPAGCDLLDGHGLLLTLTSPNFMRIYFPASLDEKPFCFSEDDALVSAAEAATKKLRPLSCNSVLSVVTTVLMCIKHEIPIVPTDLRPRPSALSTSVLSICESVVAASAKNAAAAVMIAVKEDPLGADLSLALLGMAVSSYRRDTVATPFPVQLEREGRHREYEAFIASLEGVPSMLEISRWTDPDRLLGLPPVALVALHFVLVYSPSRLRLTKNGRAHSLRETSALANGIAAREAVGGDGSMLNIAAGKPDASGARVSTWKGAGVNGANRWDVKSEKNVSTKLGVAPSHVFDVVLPGDPAFDIEAQRGGSIVAYHGSSPENFHSIINRGLLIMSDTRLMKNGAAFGPGIYLAASVEAAASFALRGDGRGTTVWGRSAFGDGRNLTTPPVCAKILPVRASPPQRFRYRLVAKCRLLTGKEVKVEGWGDHESYYIVSDPSKIRVEALLLFVEGQPVGQGFAGANTTVTVPPVHPPTVASVDRISSPAENMSCGSVEGVVAGRKNEKAKKRLKVNPVAHHNLDHKANSSAGGCKNAAREGQRKSRTPRNVDRRKSKDEKDWFTVLLCVLFGTLACVIIPLAIDFLWHA